MAVRHFGTTGAGEDVAAVAITGGGLAAEVLTYGAVLRDLRLDGIAHPLVLGLTRLADCENHSPYFGAIVGRYANRIAGGRFTLDGTTYRLGRNEAGKTHLHGGVGGFSARVWMLDDAGEDFVALSYVSADGEDGYPGRVVAHCVYRLFDDGMLSIEMTAETDRPTLVNLTTHGYFNLSDGPTVDGHRLQVAAGFYLPVDGAQLPTGEVAPVDATRFDFRELRTLSAGGVPNAYDHNFCLAAERRQNPHFAARLIGETAEMTVRTTEPGLQIYTGEGIDCPVAGLDGRRYGPRSGVCLEPQVWPDAPNHADFPSAVLRPGALYRHKTIYAFKAR